MSRFAVVFADPENGCTFGGRVAYRP